MNSEIVSKKFKSLGVFWVFFGGGMNCYVLMVYLNDLSKNMCYVIILKQIKNKI